MEINKKRLSMVLFISGILVALISAAMMFFGIAPTSLRITIGIMGIGLIAISSPLTKAK